MRTWRTAALGAALLLAPMPARAQAEPVPGDVLVTSLATGLVYQLDPAAGEQTPVPVPTGGAFASPRGLAIDRNGLLLVVDNGPKTLSRVDPATGASGIVAVFSQLTANLRGLAALADGRLLVADPSAVPLTVPPVGAVRGVTFFPVISEVSVAGGLAVVEDVAGCLPFLPPDPRCGNFYFPSAVAVASSDPVVLLVADAGEPGAPGSGRLHQGVLRVLPDETWAPGTNDQKFCVFDETNPRAPFATPRSLAIDRRPGPDQGSVLVTDSGDATLVPPAPARIWRVAASGCDDPEDPPVVPVAEGGGLLRPVGIAVAADGMIFVADASADKVFRIDPALHTVTPVSTAIDQAWDLQIYAAHPGPYFVADASAAEIFAVDPAAPSRSTVSVGGDLVEPASLEVLPMGAGLVVADPGARAIVSTTLGAPGVQTILSRDGCLAAPTSAAREAGGTYLVTDLGDAGAVPPLPPAVIRVDPSLPSPGPLDPCPFGNQTPVSTGGELVRPVAGAIDANGYLIVADLGAGTPADPARILRVTPDPDPDAAGQVTLYEGTASVPLVAPVALALDDGGSVILVADAGDATNPPAVRRLIRSVTPPGAVALALTLSSGGSLETPAGLAIDTDASILVADGGDPATADDGFVLRVDEISGLQSAVASGGTLDDPTGIGVTAPAPGAFVDQDGDGIADAEDNCLVVHNPDQRDTNADGFGNECDADYDDNGSVGVSDLGAVGRALGAKADDPDPSRYDPDLDADGDDVIGLPDLSLAGRCLGKAPGESGLVPPGTTAPCDPGPPAP